MMNRLGKKVHHLPVRTDRFDEASDNVAHVATVDRLRPDPMKVRRPENDRVGDKDEVAKTRTGAAVGSMTFETRIHGREHPRRSRHERSPAVGDVFARTMRDSCGM